MATHSPPSPKFKKGSIASITNPDSEPPHMESNMYSYYPVDMPNQLYQNSSPQSVSQGLPMVHQYMQGPPPPHHSHSNITSQGIRKRHSPDSIDTRRYSTSSSKKDLSSPFVSRRGPRSQPSDEEDDELNDEPLPANATDQEKIEYKRRQNTLAARRSRKRKMQYTQQLETTVEKLTVEKEVWKTRTMTLKHLLLSHGIPCPDFKD